MASTGCGEIAQPGWRVEKRYSSGVLIGNWSEERNRFTKGNYKHNSNHRLDFQRFPSHKPDVIVRRKTQLKNVEGLGKIIFHHDGHKYSNNLISWYDEHYNRRERENWDKLPALRHWDTSNTLAWIPEKSDYPMMGASTNFGMYENLLDRTRREQHDSAYCTTYRSSYNPLPSTAFRVSRFATHRNYPNEVKSAAPNPSVAKTAESVKPSAAEPVAPQPTADLTKIAC